MSKSQHSEGWLIYDYNLLLFSHLVMSDSLWPHGLHHAGLPCPSPSLSAWSNSCPSSQWCHPTISSSVIPFSCLQFFLASGSLPTIWLFASGGQSTGASALASFFAINIQEWFPLGFTDLISLQSKGLSKSLLQHHSSKAWFYSVRLLYGPALSSIHDFCKNHSFD